jgi:homoserine O-acetyltransferase/O-succinyltransferase
VPRSAGAQTGELTVLRSPDRNGSGELPLGTGRVEFATFGPFGLDGGELLPELTIAYRHDGRLPSEAPQVLVVHALTGSADAAGDWWNPLIGPGKALDTERIGVICTNLLGGCYGSTGPTSRDPRTGAAYGPSFPSVTTRDQARAQWRLLDGLGIRELALVAGGSLGGMIVLEIGLERPDSVRALLPIAAPASTGPMAVAWNHIQLRMIELLGDDGMALARQLAMTTYRSEADFDERFGRRAEPDGTPSIVSYLTYQGIKLVDRFDRDTYRVLAGAMDRHDITRDRGDVVDVLKTLAGGRTRLLGLGIDGDILYGPEQVRRLVAAAEAAGLAAEYRQLRSTKGHDAFLVEWAQLTEIIRDLLPA